MQEDISYNNTAAYFGCNGGLTWHIMSKFGFSLPRIHPSAGGRHGIHGEDGAGDRLIVIGGTLGFVGEYASRDGKDCPIAPYP